MAKRTVNFTLDEVLAKADNVIQITGKVADIIKLAREAKADGVVTDQEILAIKAKAQELVDAAQALADEIVEDVLD